MRTIREDPYSLTEIDGVGFARADTIAIAADFPPESDRRAQAAAWYLLGEAERRGHTHLPLGELTAQAPKLLGYQSDPDVLVSAPGLIVEDGRIYRQSTLDRECWLASDLNERATAEPVLEHTPEQSGDEKLTDEQWQAVLGAFTLAPVGRHRRPRRRQDRLHQGDRPGGEGGRTSGSASAPRPVVPPAGWARRPAPRR